ncbi:MAG: glycyl-radical enzyme activating protein [Eubacteriales bacterium]
MSDTAIIFDIKRFAVHDGDGIRTTVFFKGCRLACRWCHNPEGLRFVPETALFAHKCVLCGACAAVCPTGAHRIEKGKHLFERKKCTACGKCAAVCPAQALTVYGRRVTVEELMPELTADREFYESSGGGVTLSGGECLCQADFCASLLCELKKNGIRTAVDTAGFVPRRAIEAVMPYTDMFLYDIKAIDPALHKRCTGEDNVQILENLKYLDACGCESEIRFPCIPGYTETEEAAIRRFVSGLKHVRGIRVLPYHSHAASKYLALGIQQSMAP